MLRSRSGRMASCPRPRVNEDCSTASPTTPSRRMHDATKVHCAPLDDRYHAPNVRALSRNDRWDAYHALRYGERDKKRKKKRSVAAKPGPARSLALVRDLHGSRHIYASRRWQGRQTDSGQDISICMCILYSMSQVSSQVAQSSITAQHSADCLVKSARMFMSMDCTLSARCLVKYVGAIEPRAIFCSCSLGMDVVCGLVYSTTGKSRSGAIPCISERRFPLHLSAAGLSRYTIS